MNKLVRFVFASGLLVLLAACVPVATLETAQPVEGQQAVVGLTGSVISGSDAPVALLPYLAYRWGNGTTEFSISTQIGIRGAVKQKLADRFSVEAGLTLPWALFASANAPSLPLTLDTAALFQASEELTLIGRGMYATLSDYGGTWMGGASVVYGQERWLFEGGFLLAYQGGLVLSFSSGYRF